MDGLPHVSMAELLIIMLQLRRIGEYKYIGFGFCVRAFKNFLFDLQNFYAPNFEKVGSILLSDCLCVRPSVRSKNFKARVLKFHIWIPRQKYRHLASVRPSSVR